MEGCWKEMSDYGKEMDDWDKEMNDWDKEMDDCGKEMDVGCNAMRNVNKEMED